MESVDNAVTNSSDRLLHAPLLPPSDGAQGYAAWAHGIWFTGDPKITDSALASIGSPSELKRAALLMLRADNVLRSGDLGGALALLRRARTTSDDSASDYYTDVIVPLAISFVGLDVANSELECLNGNIEELLPTFLATRSVLAAQGGKPTESKRLAAEAFALCSSESSYLRAILIHRLSSAAFFRHELDCAEELASEALMLSSHCGLIRAVWNTQSILHAIAEAKGGGSVRTSVYGRRLTESAAAINDRHNTSRILHALLGSAAESGDEPQYTVLKDHISRVQVTPDPLVRINVCISEALSFGWHGHFEEARSTLQRYLRGINDRVDDWPTRAERILCVALLGAAYLGLNDVENCRRFVRRAISESHRPEYEMPHQAECRQKARVVAAATCTALGDRIRARRSMSAEFRGHQEFVSAFAHPPVDCNKLELPLQGYARFIASAQQAYLVQNAAPLTRAETQVLSLLIDGMTSSQIARYLDKAPSTIKMQLRSAYRRLGVSNRTEAIRRAREIGVHASLV